MRMYGEVGHIHHTLGHWEKAVEAFRCQARLISDLLAEDRRNKVYRRQLAHSLSWQGNVLRDVGKNAEARGAYDEAARVRQSLLNESQADPAAMVALANTLINKGTLLSQRDEADKLTRLYNRVIKLNRAAVAAAPRNAHFQAELALGLDDQGMFFLATGQNKQALANVREALALRKEVVASGRLKGFIERYLARNYTNLGRVLTAVGQAKQAEESYQKAVKHLERLVKEETPELPYHRADLVVTLRYLADLLKEPAREREIEAIRRRVIGLYETLKADSPEDPQNRRNLLLSYLELGTFLLDRGRDIEAAEPYRKAHELAPEDPDANNLQAWFLATTSEPGLRDHALAMRLAKKAVMAREKSGNYWNTLGVAHYRNGNFRAAIAALEKAMRFRGGGQSFDWFFLAMAHWPLGDRAMARKWYNQAVQWMRNHLPADGELRRFRAEAADLIGAKD
jgi:tetratricopeptide (TPR) repeat protein